MHPRATDKLLSCSTTSYGRHVPAHRNCGYLQFQVTCLQVSADWYSLIAAVIYTRSVMAGARQTECPGDHPDRASVASLSRRAAPDRMPELRNPLPCEGCLVNRCPDRAECLRCLRGMAVSDQTGRTGPGRGRARVGRQWVPDAVPRHGVRPRPRPEEDPGPDRVPDLPPMIGPTSRLPGRDLIARYDLGMLQCHADITVPPVAVTSRGGHCDSRDDPQTPPPPPPPWATSEGVGNGAKRRPFEGQHAAPHAPSSTASCVTV